MCIREWKGRGRSRPLLMHRERQRKKNKRAGNQLEVGSKMHPRNGIKKESKKERETVERGRKKKHLQTPHPRHQFIQSNAKQCKAMQSKAKQSSFIHSLRRIPRILLRIQDALRDELLRLRPVLDLVLEAVGPHVLLKLAGIGLQRGSGVDGGKDVSYRQFPSPVNSCQL